MNVLVDTNVLLDVLLRRVPFLEESALVWAALEEGRAKGIASAISFDNIFYVMRKEFDAVRAKQGIAVVSGLLAVAPVDGEVIAEAVASKNGDFEDAVQEISEARAGATHVVTRDRAGFAGGPLTVLSPTEFLASLAPND